MSREQIAAWYPRLFRTALRLTRNPEDAADVTQQTFYQALRHWDQFDGGALPTTWLHRILLNCARDWQRRQSVRTCRPLDETALPAPDGAPGSADEAQRREEASRLRRAIEDLPPPVRDAFGLTVLDGYTYQEAAQILDAPVGTVATHVHRARRLLQEAMRQGMSEA
jgi:RNA polymerase sigma-70 factor (ECF subfamily)